MLAQVEMMLSSARAKRWQRKRTLSERCFCLCTAVHHQVDIIQKLRSGSSKNSTLRDGVANAMLSQISGVSRLLMIQRALMLGKAAKIVVENASVDANLIMRTSASEIPEDCLTSNARPPDANLHSGATLPLDKVTERNASRGEVIDEGMEWMRIPERCSSSSSRRLSSEIIACCVDVEISVG